MVTTTERSLSPTTTANTVADSDENNIDATTTTTQHQTKKKRKRTIVEEEEKDLSDLRYVACDAQVVEFDRHGRIFRPSFSRNGSLFDSLDNIEGLVRISQLPDSLLAKLKEVHDTIQNKVTITKMVPWAGLNQDTTRLRGFGFLGEERFHHLTNVMGIKLHSFEKEGEDAELDMKANYNAKCILEGPIAETAQQAVHDLIHKSLRPQETGLPVDVLKEEELIAFQPNLHNGAKHLAAHLDYPRHEGFGKVIVTVAIKGNATILLIGPYNRRRKRQPAWRFHLNQGDCYVLSGKARNQCLHAVIVDEDGNNEHRESLNLRFGLHTQQEAEEDILQFAKRNFD